MMTIEMTTAEKVAMHLASRSTRDLIHDLDMSGIMMDACPEKYAEHMPTVRGWIMDELKRRDPEGYDAWISQEDCPEDLGLLKFIHF